MDVRASDAEREATVDQLRDAAAEGRLTFEELADRIEAASSSVTRGELARLTSDLPAEVLVRRADTAPVAPQTALGDIKRSGAWAVPADSHFRAWLGHIQLDLRQARISDPEVRIHAWTPFGTIDLLVPEGVEVDVRARSRFGQIRQESGPPAAVGAPRIVLTGGSVFGVIRVRHRRLWEKLARLGGFTSS